MGLDPDPSLMALTDVGAFNKAIVDATMDLVCAYKPNLSFYEALGRRGMMALEETVSYIRTRAPDVVVLGDAKRGDIGSVSVHYAKALFEVWGFDAITVNPYAGGRSLEPFFEYSEKGVFVWCRSSDAGADEFQDLPVAYEDGRAMCLYERVATRAKEWNQHGNVGLVVGATYPEQLEVVRSICPGMPVLMPGIGAQAGDLRASVLAGVDATGRNLLVSSSRGVLYASRKPNDFAEAARRVACRMRDQINSVLEERGAAW